MMRTLANILRYLLLKILHMKYGVFHMLMPKDKETLLFFCTGKTFADNLRAFYDFVVEAKKDKAVVLVKDQSLYKSLKGELPNVYSANSLTGMFQFLKHQKIIIDNGDARLFFFPYYLHPKFQSIINLWHGIPLKKLGKAIDKRRKESFDIQFQSYSYFTVCSEFEKELIESCYSVDEEVWVTGTPRNDQLLQKDTRLLENYPYLGKKTILYAPTWREQGNQSSFFPFVDKDLAMLNHFLEEQDAYLLLRGHREEMKFFTKENKQSSFTRILPAHQDVFPEVQGLLAHVDVLITDYSSIYLDYLLLDKPMIFIPYDIEEYREYRGFLFDYEKHSPGAKVDSQQAFVDALKASLEKPEQDALQRAEICAIFHQFKNGGACQRIYDQIKSIN